MMENLLIPIIMSLIAGLSTGIGGLLGVIKKLSMRQLDTIIGFAAGVMLSVGTLGLLNEGLFLIENYSVGTILIAIVGGLIAGMVFLLIMDKVIPHIHLLASPECPKKQYKKFQQEQMEICGRECRCPDKDKWFKCPYLQNGKCTMQGDCFCPRKLEFQKKMKYSGILLAIGLTLHNAPEGIAIGVGYLAAPYLGITMAIAIALHNVPEGLAISVPLIQGGYTKKRSFLISLLSGLSEPIACIFAVLFLQNVSEIFLAFFLAFAAGAMLYIVSDELIPESHKHGYEHEATIGLMLGFVLMLLLIIVFNV